MKLDALDHPKTLDFAARLEVELPMAIGYLELLWAFTGKKSPQGNIGKWPDGAIARACHFMGPPEIFIAALTAAGFMDLDTEHRFVIHDWPEHSPRWVKAKLKSLGLAFINSITETVVPTVVATTVDDVGLPTKGGEGKGSEGKTREGKATDAYSAGLDPQVWDRWSNFRVEIRKPIKPASIQAAQRQLSGFGATQAAVVEQSIANGWQGLFELKTTNGAGNKPVRRAKSADELQTEKDDRDAQH